MNLTVSIGNARFANPVTVASGTFDWKEEYYSLKEIRKLGALIPKTVTLQPQAGNPPPRIFETPAGMLNAIGIENAGIDEFILGKLPELKKTGVPLIISVLGYSDEEFAELVGKVQAAQGISAIELNLSCPNLRQKCLVAQDPAAVHRVVAKVKETAVIPVIAKLSPNVGDVSEIAAAAESAGADAVSLVNTFTGMAVDIEARKPVLGNVTGGLSGPAIRPIALAMVYQVAGRVKIPIIGMGGILTAQDALEFIIAGASMVAVGTGNFINPSAPMEVLDGIQKYMKARRIDDIHELIGSLKV